MKSHSASAGLGDLLKLFNHYLIPTIGNSGKIDTVIWFHKCLNFFKKHQLLKQRGIDNILNIPLEDIIFFVNDKIWFKKALTGIYNENEVVLPIHRCF